MENYLEKFGSPDEDEDEPKGESSSKIEDEKIRRLLGFRNFPKRTSGEKRALLGSEDRVRALDAITTTTLPIAKKK